MAQDTRHASDLSSRDALRRLRHDLATPLSALALHLEVARRRAAALPGSEGLREALRMAEDEIERVRAILHPAGSGGPETA